MFNVKTISGYLTISGHETSAEPSWNERLPHSGTHQRNVLICFISGKETSDEPFWSDHKVIPFRDIQEQKSLIFMVSSIDISA